MDREKIKGKLKGAGAFAAGLLQRIKGLLRWKAQVPVWAMLCAFVFVAAAFAVLLFTDGDPASSEKKVEAMETSQSGVFGFNYESDTARVFVSFSGKDRTEVTEHVTGSSAGELFLDPEGICLVLSLTREEMTEEDKKSFEEAALTEDIFLSETGEYLKLSDGKRTVILMEDSPLYLLNGIPARLGASVVRKDGRLSVPLSHLVFDFGYESMSTGTEGDSVTYTLVRQR